MIVPRVYRLDWQQDLAISADQCWYFFADPANLPVITPPGLRFEVIELEKGRFEPGMMMTHRVRPFPGMSVRWHTEITHIVPGRLFVDEQRIGPFRLWHHQHLFEEIPGGMHVRDIVHYVLPFGVFGHLLHGVVARELDAIFRFRYQKLNEMFGTPTSDSRSQLDVASV